MKRHHTAHRSRWLPQLSQFHLGCILALAASTSLPAATITTGDPSPGGISYAWQAALAGNDSGSATGTVSAWGWQDESFAGEAGFGWAHTSQWAALSIGQATTLTITIQRDANVDYSGSGNINGKAPTTELYPAFTLWAGWDNDAAPQSVADSLNGGAQIDHWHTFNNNGAVIWAEDLTYIGHVFNDSAESVTRSWFLPAGQYTLAIGGNAASDTSPPRQGYRALLTTAVPEPGSLSLLALAAIPAMRRRR